MCACGAGDWGWRMGDRGSRVGDGEDERSMAQLCIVHYALCIVHYSSPPRKYTGGDIYASACEISSFFLEA